MKRFTASERAGSILFTNETRLLCCKQKQEVNYCVNK